MLSGNHKALKWQGQSCDQNPIALNNFCKEHVKKLNDVLKQDIEIDQEVKQAYINEREALT